MQYRPLQLRHKIGNFQISPYTDTPPPPSWCTTSLLTYGCLHQQLLESASFCLCLLVTRRQNKQYPRIILTWNYSTYYNFTGCRLVLLSERAAESRSNTFSHRHAPAWYTKMAAVTWPVTLYYVSCNRSISCSRSRVWVCVCGGGYSTCTCR